MNSIDVHSDVPRLDPIGRIGLIGAGAFGRFCLDSYLRAADLSVLAVADSDPSALAQVNAPGAQLDTDWRNVVSTDAVEVVHVATPPHLRSDVVLAALAAGKSVFCEKPLALTVQQADGLIRAAGDSGVGLGVNYVMRHLAAYQTLEQFAASGLFGNLRTITFDNFAQSLPSDHWFWDVSRSGGIFVEHGVHFFDAYARIAGPAARVRAESPRREAVAATVEYRGGALGRFYHEFAFPQQTERATGVACFERGYIEIEGWVPLRLRGRVLGDDARALQEMGPPGLQVVRSGGALAFNVNYGDRDDNYRAAVVSGMRDMVLRHRDPRHRARVSVQEARDSLALAVSSQTAIARTQVVELP